MVYSVHWATPAEDFQDRPSMPTRGWDGVGGFGRIRGGVRSLVGSTDPAQMKPFRTIPAGMMETCSGNLEPCISDRGLDGQEGSQAGWESGDPAPAQAQRPPAVGDDGNRPGGRVCLNSRLLLALLPLSCSCPHQYSRRSPFHRCLHSNRVVCKLLVVQRLKGRHSGNGRQHETTE